MSKSQREISTETQHWFGDRLAGCLIGQAIGDASGFPVEGYPPEDCVPYADQLRRDNLPNMPGRGRFPFGQYTDDTQLARELLISFRDSGGTFDPAVYARRIADLFQEQRIVGRGRATEQAARNLIAGVPWTEAGVPPPSAGNGSAMRAGPLGVLFAQDLSGLAEVAVMQSQITHRDPRCAAGALAIAGAVALVMVETPENRDFDWPGTLNPKSFVESLSRWVEDQDPVLATLIRDLEDIRTTEPAQAAATIRDRCRQEPDRSDEWHGISPFVTESVAWSLYAFLSSPEDYRTTIATAIAGGGDTDTTAAMAGAISGTYHGIDRLPFGLSKALTDQDQWGYWRLRALCRECGVLLTLALRRDGYDPDERKQSQLSRAFRAGHCGPWGMAGEWHSRQMEDMRERREQIEVWITANREYSDQALEGLFHNQSKKLNISFSILRYLKSIFRLR